MLWNTEAISRIVFKSYIKQANEAYTAANSCDDGTRKGEIIARGFRSDGRIANLNAMGVADSAFERGFDVRRQFSHN